jgi:hypothetical protein
MKPLKIFVLLTFSFFIEQRLSILNRPINRVEISFDFESEEEDAEDEELAA